MDVGEGLNLEEVEEVIEVGVDDQGAERRSWGSWNGGRTGGREAPGVISGLTWPGLAWPGAWRNFSIS